jgi:hypothetical protein
MICAFNSGYRREDKLTKHEKQRKTQEMDDNRNLMDKQRRRVKKKKTVNVKIFHSAQKTDTKVAETNGLLPNHQFGFRKRHSTIEQTHGMVRRINEALENKQYCSEAFSDISEAFGKVWHTRLLYKLTLSLPLH